MLLGVYVVRGGMAERMCGKVEDIQIVKMVFVIVHTT